MSNVTISEQDIENLRLIRENVRLFTSQCAKKFDKSNIRLLDIAPQDHAGANPFFLQSKISTLDIDPNANADYTADLCSRNEHLIETNTFDVVICTEVLEHTLRPFDAVDEIYRILKPGGTVCVTVPFNFRIHGPLPDCWRFTIHGLKELFKRFENLTIETLETKDRDLMPVHYTLVGNKPLN